MKDLKELRSDWTPFERLAVSASLLAMAFLMLPLMSDRLFDLFFGTQQASHDGAPMGLIRTAKNDARQKSRGSFSWLKATSQNHIYPGDSVFTGEYSSSLILLEEDSELELGPNSLVTFVRMNNMAVPQLVRGKAKIKFSQKARIALDGRVHQLSGTNAEVQLVAQKGEVAEARLLRGVAKIQDLSLALAQETTATPLVPLEATGAERKPSSGEGPIEAPSEAEVILSPLPSPDELRQHYPQQGRATEEPSRGTAPQNTESSPPSIPAEPVVHIAVPAALAPEPKQNLQLVESKIPAALRETTVSVEASLLQTYSAQQRGAGLQGPRVVTMAFRINHWWDRHGFEAALRSRVMNQTMNPDAEIKPLHAEARYHYRLPLAWAPFDNAQSSQFSFFTGYELYRNSGSSLYLNEYQTIKVGSSMMFPLGSSWSTGGEFAFGFGTNDIQKFEIAGFLNFLCSKEWSLGAGYRVQLIRANQDRREGSVEGFSAIHYSF